MFNSCLFSQPLQIIEFWGFFSVKILAKLRLYLCLISLILLVWHLYIKIFSTRYCPIANYLKSSLLNQNVTYFFHSVNKIQLGGSFQKNLACMSPCGPSLSRRAHPKVADASAFPWSLNATGPLLQIQEGTHTHCAGSELWRVVVYVRHRDDGSGRVGEAVVQVPFHVCGLNDDHVLLDFLQGTRGKNRAAAWV